MKKFFITRTLVVAAASLTLACSVEVESPESVEVGFGTITEEQLEEDTLMELAGYETESGSDVEDGDEAKVTSDTKKQVDAKLSQEARQVLESVRASHKRLREEAQAICSIDIELKKSIREQVKAVLNDAALEREEKKIKAAEILEANKQRVEADRTAFKDCAVSNSEELGAIKEKSQGLAKACLAKKAPKHRLGKKSAPHAGFKHFVSDERKAEIRKLKKGKVAKKMSKKFRKDFDVSKLEEALLSESCSEELAEQ